MKRRDSTGPVAECQKQNYISDTETIMQVLAEQIMERVRANFAANDLDQEAHQFWVEDTFKALDRLRRKGEAFDVIIADPPSFSHGPSGTWSVSKDYKRLVAACLRVLRPGVP